MSGTFEASRKAIEKELTVKFVVAKCYIHVKGIIFSVIKKEPLVNVYGFLIV